MEAAAGAESRTPGRPARPTDPFAKALIDSASNSKLTPAAPGWADVESKMVLEEFFGKIEGATDLAAPGEGVRRQDHPDAQRQVMNPPGGRGRSLPAAGTQPHLRTAMTTGTTTAPTTPARSTRHGAPEAEEPPPLVLIVPTLVLLVAALGYPIGWQVVTSFQHYGMMPAVRPPAAVGGPGELRALVTDPDLWVIVVRSIVFCLVCALVTVAIGLGLALLMGAVSTCPRLVLQIALLLAWAMPVVASMTVWTWIVNWRNGLLNWALERVGVDAEGHNWLVEPLSFFVVAAVIVVWMSVPFVALSIYAGLTQVRTEVLEAAEIDGPAAGSGCGTSSFPSWRRSSRSSCCSSSSGTCGSSPRSSCSRTPVAWPTRPTCSARTSTSSARAPATSGWPAPSPSSCSCLTVAVSWYYVRSLMKEES